MQTTNTGNIFHLCRHQIILVLLLAVPLSSLAQNQRTDNLLDYDDLWIHYGFAMGLHSAKYRIQYSDAFATPALDSLHSVVPGNLPGWKVGFVINMRVFKYLDFRILPTVGFYEQDLTYRYTDGTSYRELKDATLVELPLLLKYKSARRGNVAMYMVGGISPAIEASGSADETNDENTLELRNWNFSIDAGIGFDLYYPLFKFSPEVRYSWGLRNMLTDTPNNFSAALKKLTYQNISFYITFEGGPTYLKDNDRRRNRRRR